MVRFVSWMCVLCGLALFVACDDTSSTGSTLGSSCTGTSDCSSGEVCSAGTCVIEGSDVSTDVDAGGSDTTGSQDTGGSGDTSGTGDGSADTTGGTDTGGCAAGQTACGDTCCNAGQACSGGACVLACSDNRAPCEGGQTCCNAARECVLDSCEPICTTVRCGDSQTCCTEDEYCFLTTGECTARCPSQVFCGPNSDCCDSGEVCFADACIEPGNACSGNADCPIADYCEPTLGECLPRAALPGCQFIPSSTATFEPQQEWSWSSSSIQPEYTRVMTTPMVMNLTDDNGDNVVDENDIPDVIFASYRRGNTSYWLSGVGYIRVLSGDDGRELYTYTAQSVLPNTTVAAGDVDNDGIPEVVAVGSDNSLLVFSPEGSIEKRIPGVSVGGWKGDGPSLADLDQDGTPEAVLGFQAFDLDAGTILWDASSSGCLRGGNLDRAGFTIPYDMDQDVNKTLEVVTSNCILDAAGNVVHRSTENLNGFTAIGNLDADALPEIVVVSSNRVYVYENDFTLKWSAAIPTSGSGGGGPPTISNFDDEPGAEIAVAGSTTYAIIKPVVDSSGNESGTVIWESPTQDSSSNNTGSSIFDFEGDGIAEPVYNDECFIHIYDTRYPGTDPRSQKWRLSNTSWTLFEYPVIVDVDNDGNAEIVTSRNDDGPVRSSCDTNWPDFDPAVGAGDGIRVFGDLADNWVPTRKIWNQHAYHITNINDDGSIPTVQESNIATFNSFRQNSQAENVFNAPDLTAPAFTHTAGCPSVVLSVEVSNDGALGVGRGVPVSFYRVLSDGSRELLGTAVTQNAILPGSSETVTFNWVADSTVLGQTLEFVAAVDDPGDGSSANNECIESNNEMTHSFLCEIN